MLLLFKFVFFPNKSVKSLYFKTYWTLKLWPCSFKYIDILMVSAKFFRLHALQRSLEFSLSELPDWKGKATINIPNNTHVISVLHVVQLHLNIYGFALCFFTKFLCISVISVFGNVSPSEILSARRKIDPTVTFRQDKKLTNALLWRAKIELNMC